MRRVHVFRQRNLRCSALVYSYITPTGRDACAFRKKPGQLVEKTRKINVYIYIYILKNHHTRQTVRGRRRRAAGPGTATLPRHVARTRQTLCIYVHVPHTHRLISHCVHALQVGVQPRSTRGRIHTHTRSARLYFGSEPSLRSARACCSVFSSIMFFTLFISFSLSTLSPIQHTREQVEILRF